MRIIFSKEKSKEVVSGLRLYINIHASNPRFRATKRLLTPLSLSLSLLFVDGRGKKRMIENED